MNIFDKILDLYYNVVFRVEDVASSLRYKVLDTVDHLKGNKSTFDYSAEKIEILPELVVKKTKKSRKSSKKKKK